MYKSLNLKSALLETLQVTCRLFDQFIVIMFEGHYAEYGSMYHHILLDICELYIPLVLDEATI